MDTAAKKGQLELGIGRAREKDRNYHLGGRSFYFFDFDDNIAFLTTPLILFHRRDGSEISISTGEYGQVQSQIGKSGLYKDYEVRLDDQTGTFRNFRDQEAEELKRIGAHRQIFVTDIMALMDLPDLTWK